MKLTDAQREEINAAMPDIIIEAQSLDDAFISAFNAMAAKNHAAMDANGFWDMRRAIPNAAGYAAGHGGLPEVYTAAQNAVDIQDLALMMTELGEAIEAVRHGNPPSPHIVEFSHVEEELADVLLRVGDYAAGRGLRVAEALIAKVQFNLTRPARHGKQC